VAAWKGPGRRSLCSTWKSAAGCATSPWRGLRLPPVSAPCSGSGTGASSVGHTGRYNRTNGRTKHICDSTLTLRGTGWIHVLHWPHAATGCWLPHPPQRSFLIASDDLAARPSVCLDKTWNSLELLHLAPNARYWPLLLLLPEWWSPLHAGTATSSPQLVSAPPSHTCAAAPL
jgi:hypothetical protein